MGLGWFRGKRKHVQSITFQEMKSTPFAEYEYARKQIAYSLHGNWDRYGYELWKYKHGYKHKISDSVAVALDALPQSLDMSLVSFEDIRNWILDGHDEYGDFQSIETLDDKEKQILGHTDEDPPIEDIIHEYMNREHPDMAYLRYDDEEDYHYYCNQSSGDPDENTIRWKIVDQYFQNDKSEAVLEYHEYGYHIETTEDDPDTEEDESSEELVQDDNGTGSFTFDCREYFYAKVFYINTSNELDVYKWIYVPYHFYTDGYTQDTGSNTLTFEPVFEIKTENNADSDYMQNQKKMLRQYGIELESLQTLIDNGKISDLRVTHAVAPDDGVKSAAIAKYLYQFFSQVTGDDFSEQEHLGSETNREIKFTLSNDLEVKQKFYLEEQVVEESFPRPSDFYEYKLKLVQKVTNKDMYYDEVKEAYDYWIDGSETNIKLMYSALEMKQIEEPDNNSYQEAFAKLPPKDCWKDTYLSKYEYVFCENDIDNMNEIMHDVLFDTSDPNNEIQLWEIDSTYTKRARTIQNDEEERLYITIEKIDTPAMFYNDEDTTRYVGAVKTVVINLYYKIDDNSYRHFRFRNGRLEYKVDGHTAIVRHEKINGEFRIFMLNGYMNNLRFKEYTALHDRSLCALVYVHQVIKIHWYQRAGWRIVVQIVVLIVTYYTGGAGSVFEFLIDVAVNIAVGYVASKIASMISGRWGAVVGAVIAVALLILTKKVDVDNTSQLWLATADEYTKLQSQQLADEVEAMQKEYEKYKKEIIKKTRMLQEYIDAQDQKGYSKETIITNIANQAYWEGYDGPELTSELFDKLTESELFGEEIKPIDYNLAETEYNKIVEIPRNVYEFEDKMREITYFGSDQFRT